MPDVEIVAVPKAGISVARRRQARSSEVLDYIPGSTLRGALAQVYLRRHPPDASFEACFLNGQSVFPNLYPAENGMAARPAPMTLARCKRGGEKHGVQDTLVPRAIEAITGKVASAGWFCEHSGPGGPCHYDLQPVRGLIREADAMPIRAMERSLRTHVGIDRRTGSAHHGALFGIQSIFPPEFRGRAHLGDEALATLQQLLVSCQASIWVGQDRARGYGEIFLSLEVQPRPSAPSIETLIDWDRQFRAALGERGVDPGDGFFLCVDLMSDTLLVDRFLRPAVGLGSLFPDASEVVAVVATRQVRGWNAAHGLPREDDWAMAAGSVFLLCLPEAPGEADLARFPQRVGLRQNEGFGQLRYADPIHLRPERRPA